MRKISPTLGSKSSLVQENLLDYQEYSRQLAAKKSKFFMQSLHDSFNFLNLKTISNISKVLSHLDRINIICLSDLNETVDDFMNKLTALKLFVGKDESKNNNEKSFTFFVDVLENETADIKLLFKEKSLIISNKKKAKGKKLLWAKSASSFDVTIKDKLEIFLNCIYMNILTRKILQK